MTKKTFLSIVIVFLLSMTEKAQAQDSQYKPFLKEKPGGYSVEEYVAILIQGGPELNVPPETCREAIAARVNKQVVKFVYEQKLPSSWLSYTFTSADVFAVAQGGYILPLPEVRFAKGDYAIDAWDPKAKS